MKRFVPCLLIVAAGLLSLTLATSDASAQKWCKHIHQISKKLVGQITTLKNCDYCTREKMEVYYVHQKIKGSVVQDCDCDETNDDECDLIHGHPVSDDGDWEAHGCAFTDPSLGIPGNSEFTATIKRWIKYCKDGSDNPGYAWPRGGYHKGTWKITDGVDGSKLAGGSLEGCDGIDPSFERMYSDFNARKQLPRGPVSPPPADARGFHSYLPGTVPTNMGPDFCESGGSNGIPDSTLSPAGDCYLPGWSVGCLTGNTTNTFFTQTCPPSNSYGDINDDTTWEKWKLRACYSGGTVIDPTDSPCEQWATPDWFYRLEGVIAINAP